MSEAILIAFLQLILGNLDFLIKGVVVCAAGAFLISRAKRS
jgi:hypothetical protein